MKKHVFFIDPPSRHYLNDKLFDLNDSFLNRDDTLLPFVNLKSHLFKNGISLHTADKLSDKNLRGVTNHYWSLGNLDRYKSLLGQFDVKLRGFLVMEPPLVDSQIYDRLPELTNIFENVYIHNLVGDGYSMENINTIKLKKLYWPSPYCKVISKWWGRLDRINKLVMIAGNHKPRNNYPEYYSLRINAISELFQLNAIDLYGRGWNKFLSRHSLWLPYFRNILPIIKSYKGSCTSKLEILSKYRFCLCYENTPMKGFITEKIMDCFYAGTVPVYLGAPDINEFIPEDCYVDARNFSSFEDLSLYLQLMPISDWTAFRNAAMNFVQSDAGNRFYCSLINIVKLGDLD